MSRLLPLAVLLFGVVALTAGSPSAPAQGPTHPAMGGYVGAERCRSCHLSAYTVWEKSAHARAHLSLPPDRQKDPKCLSCHSPDPSAQASGVQCESCHGAGGSYSYDFVMKDRALAKVLGLRDPGERTCKSCHLRDHALAPFDFAAKQKLIAHGR